MKRYLAGIWRSLKIKSKITLFTDAVLCIIVLSIILAIWSIKACIYDFSVILRDNSLTSDFVNCVETETDLFERYVKTGNADLYAGLEEAMASTAEVQSELSYDYRNIGESRYARTWSIRNLYQVYCVRRDLLLNQQERGADYISRLYEVYDMQEYLLNYAKLLMQDTMEDGVSVYAEKVRTMIVIPVLVIAMELLFFASILKLSGVMSRTIIEPVMELAEASRKITENDYYIEDVQVQSEDELGDLVHAFNKMKYATGGYITALEERRKALDLYHAEELERLRIAGRLDAMELELLKSQINPHFLFNTLNVIGGMANLENAQTTEAMIQSLSNLFRYNLKTPEEKVTLARELKVIRDYMFLQEMRFGGRIRCEIDCRIDAELVMIPTFTFQPLVENAIIHGLAPKEEGGVIHIRILKKGGLLCIDIADDGLGMDTETLRELRRRMHEEDGSRTNIGLFNIYKRIHTMYALGSMRIYSRQGRGTIICIRLPDERGENIGG